MRRRLTLIAIPAAPALALTALVLAAVAAHAQAAEFGRDLVFREPLGVTWTSELVHADVRIGEPNVAAATFSLSGPDGRALPMQVEVVEGKPDAVRRARLWFLLTLPRGEEVRLRLAWRDDAQPAPPAPGQPPVARASARRDGDAVILSTGALDLALAAPEKAFAKPLAGDAMPPVVRGVRLGGKGPWLGPWRFDGTPPLREIKTTVEADGPVWAQVRVKCTFEKGQTWEAAFRAVAGEPWVDVTEKPHAAPEARLRMTLDGALAPREVFWMPWTARQGDGVRAAYDLRRDRLDRLASGGSAFATLRPRRSLLPDQTQVCLAVGTGEGAAAVGAAMIAPADWTKPYALLPTAHADAGAARIEFPLPDGRRRWLLLAGPAERFASKGRLQEIFRRAADIPLDRVLNEWVLEWKRDASRPAPHVLTTPARLAAVRAAAVGGADTPDTRLIARVLDGRTPGDRTLAEFLAGRRDRLPAPSNGVEVFLARSYQDEFLAPDAFPRRLAEALPLADLAAAGSPAGDAHTAMLACILADPNYWPPDSAGWDAGDAGGNRTLTALAVYTAAMMPDHPHARRWMDAALARLQTDLRRRVTMPDGACPDGPAALADALAFALPVMRAAAGSGLGDPFRWPELRAAMEFLRNVHTPPDPRLGRRTLVPAGNAPPWGDGVAGLFGVAAAGVRESDAALSAAWMAIYRDAYPAGGDDLVRDALLADSSLPAAKTEEMAWPSRAYPGFGAVLRSRAGRADETFAAFFCGSPQGRACGEELAFHFAAAGAPLVVNWPGTGAGIVQEHMRSRISLGNDENMDGLGQVVAWAASPVADVVAGQVRSDRLRRVPHLPQDVIAGAALPRRTPASAARYRRLMALVKHDGGPLRDYLVIRDEPAAAEPATFNLFMLARGVERDGRTFRFAGQLQTDALLFMATPEPDRVAVDQWSWPSRGAAAMIPPGFQPGRDPRPDGELQQWLRVTETPGRPFLVILYPLPRGEAAPAFEPLADGRGVRVTLGDATEEVFLATDADPKTGGQAVVRRGGKTFVLLKTDTLPPL